MKLYFIDRNNHEDVDYDEYFGFVISADNEEELIPAIIEHIGPYGSIEDMFPMDDVTITVISDDSKAPKGVVISSFHHA